MSLHTTIGAAALGLESFVAADSPSGQTLLNNCKTFAFGQSREPLTQVEDWVYGTLGDAAARAEAAKFLCAVLGSDATFDCKQFVCRQLALVGSEADVPAIAPLLSDAKLSHPARYALERIPGDQVDAALLKALGSVNDDLKPGIINSLGERRCAKAVADIAKLTGSSNENVSRDAYIALGKIGNVDAAAALLKTHKSAGAKQKAAAANALLLCAEATAAAGDVKGAKKLYDAADSGSSPKPARNAAKLGLEKINGTK